MCLERLSQRLEQLGGCALITAAKGYSHCEFTGAWKIDFPGQRNISVPARLKLPVPTKRPVHFEIVHEALPTITETDIANRAAREASAARHDQVNVFTLSSEQLDTAHIRTPAGVAGAKAGDVRRQQRVESQLST